ncbi:MAG: hypothetical protein ACPF8U_05460 [Flavobacteriales bacterium]
MTFSLASRIAMLCMGAALSLSMNAQDPWLGLVAETEHTEGDLAGMTTYRLYVYTQNADDFVVSCSGDDENPLYLTSTSEPAWFQHELATTALATDVNPAFFASFPEFAYDSWLTIGAEDNTASADVIDLADPDYDAFAIFEAGQNVAVETTVGNAWFVLPIPTNVEAIAGEDLRVLVAQFTTSGDISGQIQVQIFYNGNNQDEFREVLPILTACNDPEALNYEPLSYSDDGCEYSEVDRVLDLVTTYQLEAFPSPATTFANVTFPAHLADRLAGAELRATGLDGRVVGSWPIQSSVERIDVSGLAAGQYVLTVAGFDDATLRFQGDLVVTK